MEERIYYVGWLLVSVVSYVVIRLGWWRPKDCDPGDYVFIAAGLGLFWPVLPLLPIILFFERRKHEKRR